MHRGVLSQDFSNDGVEGIVMTVIRLFPPVTGCLLKKGFQKGGSRAPQGRPLSTPLIHSSYKAS